MSLAAPAPQIVATRAGGAGLGHADTPVSTESGDFASVLGALQTAGSAAEKTGDAPTGVLADEQPDEPLGWPLHSAPEMPVEDPSGGESLGDAVVSEDATMDTAPDVGAAGSVTAEPAPSSVPFPPTVALVPPTVALVPPPVALVPPPVALVPTPVALVPPPATAALTVAATLLPALSPPTDGAAPPDNQATDDLPLPLTPAEAPTDAPAPREGTAAEAKPSVEPAPSRMFPLAPVHSSVSQAAGAAMPVTVPATDTGASVRSLPPLGDVSPSTDSAASPTATTVAAPGVAATPPVVLSTPAPAAPQTAPATPQTPPAPLAAQLASPLFTLTGARAGEHLMTIQVTPDNIGPVTVRAMIGIDDIRIELFSPTDAGREAVRQILTDLRRDLAGGGLAATLDLSGKNFPEERRQGQPGESAPRAEARHAENVPTTRQSAQSRPVSTMTLDITV